MTKPPAPPRPPYFPAATVREQIAAGPKFEKEPGICAACGEPGPVDKATGTCRPCWRCHRWSAVAERPNPNITEPHATRERKGG